MLFWWFWRVSHKKSIFHCYWAYLYACTINIKTLKWPRELETKLQLWTFTFWNILISKKDDRNIGLEPSYLCWGSWNVYYWLEIYIRMLNIKMRSKSLKKKLFEIIEICLKNLWCSHPQLLSLWSQYVILWCYSWKSLYNKVLKQWLSADLNTLD